MIAAGIVWVQPGEWLSLSSGVRLKADSQALVNKGVQDWQ